MSEFKYACPVCGQHISCDSSQAGTVMDCPTCFQKITVPQPPAGDNLKLLLTGSKATDRTTAMPGLDSGTSRSQPKKFPGVLVVTLILVFMSTAAATIYWATIIHPLYSSGKSVPTNALAVLNRPVPPPANSANWRLVLGSTGIPNSPVVGRIHGQDFIVEQAVFQTGLLELWLGTRRSLELGMVINFSGAPAEELSGKTINVMTNAGKAAQVTLRWKDAGGTVQKADFDTGYALRLEFGAMANDHLPGKIYLCTPDAQKSYLVGSFNADVRPPDPNAPP
jgi:DNA-directed RNA polymerase subunit RPC12/RpoP